MAIGRGHRVAEAGTERFHERDGQAQHQAHQKAKPGEGAEPSAGQPRAGQRRREFQVGQPSINERAGPAPSAKSAVLTQQLCGKGATAAAPAEQLDAAPAPAASRSLQPAAERAHEHATNAETHVAGAGCGREVLPRGADRLRRSWLLRVLLREPATAGH